MVWPSVPVLESFGARDAAVTTLDGGHVHQTFAAHKPRGGALVIQAVNAAVTGDAWALAERTLVVAEALAARPDSMLTDRRALRTRRGEPAARDAEGVVWRAFELVDEAVAANDLANPPAAGTVAFLFGRFGRRATAALPAPFAAQPFHDLGRRYRDWAALPTPATKPVPDPLRREAQLLVERVGVPSGLSARTVHNDAKPANLLVDTRTGTPLSIIDLDLVDRGTILDDVGDLVRSQAFPGEALDVDRVGEVFDGYLRGLEPLLDHHERILFSRCGEVITLELALRRLTDHMAGAGYFADAGGDENLEQAAVQLKRARSLVERRADIDEMGWRLTDPYAGPGTG